MKLVYVTGNSNKGASLEEVESWVLENGDVPICPYNSSLLTEIYDNKAFTNACLTILERCDFVILAPGWECSEVVEEEIKFAQACNIPIYVFEEDGELAILEE